MANKPTQQNIDIPPSIEAIFVQGINEERLREARKKYFKLAELMANSVHEITVHFSLISSFLMMLHPSDQKKVARLLKLDIDLCKEVETYTKTLENLPKPIREKALMRIQDELIKPIIDKCIESIRIKK